MPIHDWTRVNDGTFHDFHVAWITEIRNALNQGLLPEPYYAQAEQIVGEAMMDDYVLKRRTIVIRHSSGDRIVALLEIVSPGNKSSRHALQSFVEKAVEALYRGYHLLIVDLFPPSKRDPKGIHPAIWHQITDDSFELPADKPLTLAAYSAGSTKRAYVENTAVGQELIEMPLFLDPDHYINVPLEETYLAAYRGVPRRWKQVLEAASDSP